MQYEFKLVSIHFWHQLVGGGHQLMADSWAPLLFQILAIIYVQEDLYLASSQIILSSS